jgi:hypothetical protein
MSKKQRPPFVKGTRWTLKEALEVIVYALAFGKGREFSETFWIFAKSEGVGCCRSTKHFCINAFFEPGNWLLDEIKRLTNMASELVEFLQKRGDGRMPTLLREVAKAYVTRHVNWLPSEALWLSTSCLWPMASLRYTSLMRQPSP